MTQTAHNEFVACAGQYLRLVAAPNPHDRDDWKVHNVTLAKKVSDSRFEGYGRFPHGVSFVPEGQAHRRVMKGPLVPGPWASAFQKCTALTAARVSKTPRILVEDGDVLDINGLEYVVRWDRGQWLKLDRILDDGTLEKAPF